MTKNSVFRITSTPALLLILWGAAHSVAQAKKTVSAETEARISVAATTLSDTLVVDCQLPGRLMQGGSRFTYLTPGTLQRLSAVECRTRGGEYTVGDLAGGNFSLKRWLPVAEHGDPEAQYYVARIYANGMDGVPQDFGKAAQWYQHAADQKYGPAMQELGYLYEKGLGVKEDRLLAINLQRQASGLGDDLDYAWKLAAAKEEAAQASAQLTEQLESLNAELAALRFQAAQTSDELQAAKAKDAADRAALLRTRSTVKDLQAKLAQTPSGDAGKVKDLQAELAAKQAEAAASEKSLGDAQRQLSTLQSQMTEQQQALEANLAKSQTTNTQLTELLASRNQETADLKARLVQSDQRLERSQQELADLRADYRRGLDELSAQKALLAAVRAKQGDGGAALLAAKQAEIDQQTRRVEEITAQLAELRKQSAAAANGAAAERKAESRANASDAENAALKAEMARMKAQLDEQTAKLAAQRQDIANWSSKSAGDRAAMERDMAAKLEAKSAELQRQQRRIDSMESDAAMLRDEVAQIRAAREKDMGETDRAREALRAAQERISDQREKLDKLMTQTASERNQLVSEREQLAEALSKSNSDREMQVSTLKAEIQEKESIIEARTKLIATLQQQLSSERGGPTMALNNPVFRMPAATMSAAAARAPLAAPIPIPANISGKYYALVIGNGNYHYIGSLGTPTSDARSVQEVLEQNYGFKVKALLDATAQDMMLALHEYARTLTDSDRLLIYYAGHGGTQDGPPEAAFWLGVDADPETKVGFVSSEMVRSKIKEMRAKHVLLVSDSCFASSITHPSSTTVGRAMNQKRFDAEWNLRARVVLTSGMDTPVVDSAGDRTHSLFAKHFLAVLRQNDGVLSGEMLSHEIALRMQPEAQRLKVAETPTYSVLQDANHNNGDFFFIPASSATQLASLR